MTKRIQMPCYHSFFLYLVMFFMQLQGKKGYVDHKGIWVDGFRRKHHAPGKAWVPGHYAPRGRWIHGHLK